MRWRGAASSSLRAVREVLRPFMYSHAWHIFQTDLDRPLMEPYAKHQVEVKIFSEEQEFQEAIASISVMDIPPQEVTLRFARGDVAAVAFVEQEPAGHMWITFADGMELAFGVRWILRPDECLRYGSFVVPRFRGLGIHSSMNRALNEYARQRGLTRTFASIGALNPQSLNLAKHARNPKIMTVVLVHIHGVNWTFAKATGAPLSSHFSRSSRELYRVRKAVGGEL